MQECCPENKVVRGRKQRLSIFAKQILSGILLNLKKRYRTQFHYLLKENELFSSYWSNFNKDIRLLFALLYIRCSQDTRTGTSKGNEVLTFWSNVVCSFRWNPFDSQHSSELLHLPTLSPRQPNVIRQQFVFYVHVANSSYFM